MCEVGLGSSDDAYERRESRARRILSRLLAVAACHTGKAAVPSAAACAWSRTREALIPEALLLECLEMLHKVYTLKLIRAARMMFSEEGHRSHIRRKDLI